MPLIMMFAKSLKTAIAVAAIAAPSLSPALAVEKKDFKFAWSIYVGWMPWGYAADTGIVKKWADKYGITIEVKQFTDYVESINQYTAGAFDAVTVTNMDALSIPCAGGVETTLPLAGATMGPVIAAASLVPPLALLPVLFIALGLGETSKITLIVLGTTLKLIRDLALRTVDIPREQIIKAQTLGGSSWQIGLRVVLPQMLPPLSMPCGWRSARPGCFSSPPRPSRPIRDSATGSSWCAAICRWMSSSPM